ncbi:MAG: carbohydrate-binding domain-containing protein, partial [Lachnospiraceae bacterium]|nr:carbohydrate-binding domain-containing protein [Lachnospiraceae bacterium]
DENDAHSAEEAAEHAVITITKPGTYEVSGSISKGQIAVDLGEDAEENPEAVVNLVLNDAEISCSVAPSIVILNAYECGSDDTENATPDVDTAAAGFNLILAKDSENIVNGAYVAKIYKDGTTKEDVEKDEAKKKYKFDAAIDSQVSFNIDAQENGKLTVNAENEGISSALHMTINGGNIVINSADDSINTSEDYVSVLTINGGVITCDSGLGDEGDGIDSNGYIVMNGGYVIACANAKSQDSGIDSDLGIYVNGGTLLASGNMYDQVSKDSAQQFAVFSFGQSIKENELILITDAEDNPVTAFSAVNDYSIVVYSCPDLTEGTYHLYKVSSVEGDLNGSIYTNITAYKDAVQLQYTSGSLMGGFGGGFNGQMPEDMKFAEGERPEMPEGMEFPEGERPEMPEGMEFPEGERPEMPEGMEFPEGERSEMPEGMEFPEGERPEMPEGMEFPEGEVPAMAEGEMKGRGERPMGGRGGADMGGNTEPSTEFTLSKETYQFAGITES